MGLSYPGAQALLADNLWDQTARVYRPSVTNVAVVQAVLGLEAVKGRRGPTPNYDVHRALAGVSKENNIMTSDTWKFGREVDIRAADVLHLIEEDTWWVVAGDPKPPRLVPRASCYLTTTGPPSIVAGDWGA